MAIEGVPLVGLSAPALLGLAVFLLLVGKIVPRATLLDKAAEADRWREAYENEREARAHIEANMTELTELARTNTAVIKAMFDTVGHVGEVGDPDGVPKAKLRETQ